MQIEKARSEWLRAIEHDWIRVERGEYAPCLFDPGPNRTWMRFRLWLREPFRVNSDEVNVATSSEDRINAQIDPDDECLPEYLRQALSDDLFDEVFLMGPKSPNSDTVTSVMIHVEAHGQLGDVSRFRDFVVKKLLKKSKKSK